MKALGLDLSLTHTGICYLKDDENYLLSSIKSKPSGDLPLDELRRIEKIVTDIGTFIESCDGVDVAVIEGLAFMSRNSTALTQLSGLNYMVRSLLHGLGIKFVIVAPTTLKKFITSSGNAPKDHIMLSLFKNYGVTILDNNEADAYGLAQLGAALTDKQKKGLTVQQKEVLSLLNKQY